MAAKKSFFSRIKLVYRPSSPLLKCVVIAAIVLSTICLMVLRGAILEFQQIEETLRQEGAMLTQENADLARRIEELGTVQSVLYIAAEKLGLVSQDAIIFLPRN